MKNRLLLLALLILTMGLLLTSSVWAGDDPEADADPPQAQAQSSVGRLSVTQGQVSTMHGEGGQWVTGTVNTPIVPGDQVSTGENSRAELQLDFANAVRLDQRTQAMVTDLQQGKIQMQVSSGLVEFTALKNTQSDVEIDTPNMGVHPLGPGVFRVQVKSPSETLLIVREGEAEVMTNEGSTKVEAGQIINIRGLDNPEYKIDPAPGPDDFDKWSMDRDRQLLSSQTSQHEDPNYMGSSDLDSYGQWSEVPDQGWCWTPQVDAGWVPYTDGNWGWEPGWGWTWISGEPWGWAPYHSGFWFSYGGHWHWRPDHGHAGGWGTGRYNRWGGSSAQHFLPRGGGVMGRPTANMPSFGTRTTMGRTNFMGPSGRTASGSISGWQGYHGSQSSGQNGWGRFVSPTSYNGTRPGYSGAARGTYYGNGARPPLQLNRPIMRQRAPSGYYGGGRTYGAPYGGNRSYPAPNSGWSRNYPGPSGGNHSSSAPSGGGHSYSAPSGGGGGHSSGGGGGHSGGGGGHGGGGRH